jgi:hypothetical protein
MIRSIFKRVDNLVAGSYTVTYTVTDSAGNVTTATRSVTVNPPEQNQKLAGPSRIVKDSAPRFALGFAFVVFINSFIYTANVGDVAFWFQVFFSLVILLYMFIMGRSYADDYLKKVLIVDLQTRFNIIRDYLSDKVKEVKK